MLLQHCRISENVAKKPEVILRSVASLGVFGKRIEHWQAACVSESSTRQISDNLSTQSVGLGVGQTARNAESFIYTLRI
jgi:hypothetical protein